MFVSKNMERLADIRSLASIPSESQVSVYCRVPWGHGGRVIVECVHVLCLLCLYTVPSATFHCSSV